MLGFILRRLVSGVVLIFVISVIAYSLLYLGGGDIARRILGQSATTETVAKKAAELGLDRPLPVQYLDWITSAFQGDLGRSWFTGQLVSSGVTGRLAVTLSIVLGATIIAAIVSVILGVLAARRGGWIDNVVQFISVIGFAIPSFLIALVLVITFAINLRLFKATGYIPITTSFSGWVASVTLPIIALAIGAIATVSQQVRGSVVDAMSKDYVRTLRSRGLGTGRVIYKHVLRNAGGPALAVLAVQFIGLLGGAVIIEQIFALPGIGQLAVQATTQGDIPIVMGVVIATAIIVVVVNLLIDLAQAALNPKVRLS
ncbi:ABC transporter permease [Plantibacter sp. VKM Ac-2885]|jgi:peptide/nickel transport system permease protein|uniref:Peptide/nickel transport system permease protein n=2 Tax=Plantibacter TaxID=190323 RepID=A0A3N2C7P7_9MICO|nr:MULTISPECIES: ABC transporter permease [Plantibacter]MBD8534845.1 ABC transporter permease [Plantibacter sp. CFBP 13570]MBF4511220.1 ABC transporter permease [Plantibacter sp. VKM Ac-2885]ROR83497.1 peptide/nickel transport system permease protein [Plantibacter flavus]CAH0236760.1 Glutathione transport system permease protein GsiC [Plantibacter cousiniae]SMG24172.1 peptide/nickel transport system permease protein [Plantibacter flavus]